MGDSSVGAYRGRPAGSGFSLGQCALPGSERLFVSAAERHLS
jgi:hypothetical protein